jgi:hypothetical protein
LIVSGCTTNSRVRERVPSPDGTPAPRKVSVRSVCVHAAAGADQRLGRLRHDLAVGDQRGDVAKDLIGQ